MVCNFGLIKEIVIRKDYKSTYSIIMEILENQEQSSGLETIVDMQSGEVDVESPAEGNEIQNVEKIPTARENTEVATDKSKDFYKTTDDGQVVNVEDTTIRGKDKNVERTNDGMIEAVKEGESESGAYTPNEGQEAMKVVNKLPMKVRRLLKKKTLSVKRRVKVLKVYTSSESDNESDKETTTEDEDEAIRQTITQENRVDMNKIVTYRGRDNYQSLNSVGLTPVEKSSNEMTPTETNSGNIYHERVNKENSITVSPKTMAINVQESQPAPEVENKPGRSRT